ncbi:hypothetical protein [Streptomyces sp. NPDC055036]
MARILGQAAEAEHSLCGVFPGSPEAVTAVVVERFLLKAYYDAVMHVLTVGHLSQLPEEIHVELGLRGEALEGAYHRAGARWGGHRPAPAVPGLRTAPGQRCASSRCPVVFARQAAALVAWSAMDVWIPSRSCSEVGPE